MNLAYSVKAAVRQLGQDNALQCPLGALVSQGPWFSEASHYNTPGWSVRGSSHFPRTGHLTGAYLSCYKLRVPQQPSLSVPLRQVHVIKCLQDRRGKEKWPVSAMGPPAAGAASPLPFHFLLLLLCSPRTACIYPVTAACLTAPQSSAKIYRTNENTAVRPASPSI